MRDYLKNLAADLLTLEVNTIVKEQTTSSKMPATKRVALLEIARGYRELLVDYGLALLEKPVETREYYKTVESGRFPVLFQWLYGGEYSFKEIYNIADAGSEYYAKLAEKSKNFDRMQEYEERSKLLVRLVKHSSNLIGMFKMRRKDYSVGEDVWPDPSLLDETTGHYPPLDDAKMIEWNNDIDLSTINKVDDLDLTPDQVTLIRKTWEIGTQRILMQTVVQIDGDITNYLTNQFVNLSPELKAIVLNLHNDATESGARIWNMLFKTVSQLAGTAFRKIFEKKS
ncbi:hypothetical protein [Chondrinema litorale]|uniref:hypothetical protein n=1 Tax=Chondrinema litorale TaxID=2994555 RepID=UPI0025436F11|nr:hypothetical protein [Chondrinema litorale]UZR92945.1 hypothetical protein OQ292_13870 [Chondrinema litorale]